MKHRPVIVLALAFGVTAASGCGSIFGPDEAGPEGTYALVSVDGRMTPFVVIHTSSVRAEILGRRVTLAADGSYSDEIDFAFHTEEGVSQATTRRDGDWVAPFGRLTLTYPDREAVTGRVADGTMDFTEGGMDFRLVR